MKFQDVFNPTFQTTSEDFSIYNGKPFTVLRELGDDERDPECGRMFQIRFEDGRETGAFADEVFPSVITNEYAIRFYELNATGKWNTRYIVEYVVPTVNKLLQRQVKLIDELAVPHQSPIWDTRNNQMTRLFVEYLTGLKLTGVQYKDKASLQKYLDEGPQNPLLLGDDMAVWFKGVSHLLPNDITKDFNDWISHTAELGDIYDRAEHFLIENGLAEHLPPQRQGLLAQ